MGGGSHVMRLLRRPDELFSLSPQLQRGIFDLLYIILRKGVYDIVRFQFNQDTVLSQIKPKKQRSNEFRLKRSLNTILLGLLQHEREKAKFVTRKIIRLLGITFSAGSTADELREMLFLLKAPTIYTVSLLQGLKVILKQDATITKASPPAFFNFGGYTSGLYSVFGTFPFIREYQIFTWFRIEKFESSDSESNQPFKQHIFSVVDSSNCGIDVYLEKNILTIAISDSKLPISIVQFKGKEVRFSKGVWYHICIKHSKPRLFLFSKDEMSVYIDNNLVFQDGVKFPNPSNIGTTSLVCGRDFNGQIGPIYFLSEPL